MGGSFRVRVLQGGEVYYSKYCTPDATLKTFVLETHLSFATFVQDHSYVVDLVSDSHHFNIDVVRSAPGTPATITNYNALATLWIPTSFNSAGRTQMLYTKPGMHCE